MGNGIGRRGLAGNALRRGEGKGRSGGSEKKSGEGGEGRRPVCDETRRHDTRRDESTRDGAAPLRPLCTEARTEGRGGAGKRGRGSRWMSESRGRSVRSSVRPFDLDAT